MQTNKAFGTNRSFDGFGTGHRFARWLCLHCYQGGAGGTYAECVDFRVAYGGAVNEFLGSWLKQRVIRPR